MVHVLNLITFEVKEELERIGQKLLQFIKLEILNNMSYHETYFLIKLICILLNKFLGLLNFTPLFAFS